MRSRRRWWVAAVVAVLGVGGWAIGWADTSSSACSSAAVGVSDVPRVFAAPSALPVRSEPALVRLIAALERSGFGRVLGAAGYDRTASLRSAALSDGFANWTPNNAVIGFRDTRGRIRWGLRQTSDPQAWAVVGTTFLNLDLRPGKPVRIARYDATSGAVSWCADAGRATRPGDPLGVAAGTAGSVWLVTAGPALSRILADGSTTHPVPLTDVDRAGFLQQVGPLLIVGGRASHLLAAPDPRIPVPRPGDYAVSAFDAGSLQPRWHWGQGLTAHVVSSADGLVVIEVARGPRLTVSGVDLTGRQRWSTALPAGTTADMVVDPNSNTLLVRTERTVSGYDAGRGSRQWLRTLGSGRVFPDGFELGAQAKVGRSLLLAGSEALMSLDPASGRVLRYALPTEGAATTFWPYQVVVSARAAIVETNAGAVLLALSVRQ